MATGTFDPGKAFDPGDGGGPRQKILFVLGALVLAAVAWFVWVQLTAPVTRKVKQDQDIVAITTPDLPPPPPPPPPPPQQKPPEPTEQQVSPAPAPQPDAPKAPAAAQMDAPASAGVGGIASGSGTGMGSPGSGGTCLAPPCGGGGGGGGPAINEAFYRRTLSSELQAYIDRDKRLSRLVFDAGLHISISPGGAVTSVELVRPSGKTEVDQQLTAILRAIRGLSPPPAGIRFPQNVKVRGRKAFS